ncbi:receptor-type tyrosine-protein phosphatase H-like [Brachyhypopomus gauderio]|uniref:receptor-type tyrosine-protein phosphatase H-like n=1 Tax=Brachyhypopomus gauderio TaxID=698409 RepID=UPI00404349DE
MGRLALLVCLCRCVAVVSGQTTSYASSAPSTPPDVISLSVTHRSETTLTLQWATSNSTYSYKLSYDGRVEDISASQEDSLITHTVSSLSPGTEYTFILYTVFEGRNSTGVSITNYTTPSRVDNISVTGRNETALILQWNKVNNKNYSYMLKYSVNTTYINVSGGGDVVTHTVSGLSPGTEYTFSLYTVFKDVKSSEFTFTNVTTPSRVDNISVTGRNETALILQWNKVNSNNYSYMLKYSVNTTYINVSGGGDVVTHTVSGLSPGTEYTFSLYTVFKDVKSSEFTFTNVTTPSRVDNISVTGRNETALILQWNKVNNKNYSYMLKYSVNTTYINVSGGGDVVTHTVSGLSPGTEYTFSLYTVFKDVKSSEFTFTNVTTPSRVDNISVTGRNETALILQWNKVNNNNYNYTLKYSGNTTYINVSGGGDVVTHTVSGLSPGTEYTFSLYTVFKDVKSSEFTFTNVTTPSRVDNISVTGRNETALILQWNKVNNNNYSYMLKYSVNTTYINVSGGGDVVTHTVSCLSPGTEYTFSLYTVFKDVESSEFTFTNVTIPAIVSGLRCEYASGGYGLTLVWDPPIGVRTAVQVILGDKRFIQLEESLFIGELQPTQWYTMTVTALSGAVLSAPVSVSCQTDPRGVIAGVLSFLLVLTLCIGIFIWYRKSKLPGVLSKFKSSTKDKVSSYTYSPIPIQTFPEHFNSMSCDENQGFCREYEDLSAVGTEQSHTAADLPDNKKKNRFINVLPYESSRVKLSVESATASDYINANYMHGYNGNLKQYIAAQGPLPCTVSDFWRMVWEQKSQIIVMLTNCTENGRIKCEQYWPLDYTPCVYGNLQVTVTSEHKETSWTLREFVVRNKSTCEEQTVTHFHFTAWPDHGVPRATHDLIQFRGVIRQHMESFPFMGPTVVHCSAGVGRTGTLIALDILLQQLEKEAAVNIAGCVHRMRLSRPLMVQTEAQYVFLHQCIMDSLRPKQDSQQVQDSIYENSDMIYANALALSQVKSASTAD